MDDDGDEEMVDEGNIFERLGSGFGTSILSASDFDSKNGLFGFCWNGMTVLAIWNFARQFAEIWDREFSSRKIATVGFSTLKLPIKKIVQSLLKYVTRTRW